MEREREAWLNRGEEAKVRGERRKTLSPGSYFRKKVSLRH